MYTADLVGLSIVSLVPTDQVEYRRPSGDWAMQGGEQDGEDATMEEDGTNFFCQMWSVTLFSLCTTPVIISAGWNC